MQPRPKNAQFLNVRIKNENEKEKELTESLLKEAIIKKDVDTIEMLFNEGMIEIKPSTRDEEPINSSNANDQLIKAVKNSDIERFEKLLTLPEVNVNYQTKSTHSSLATAYHLLRNYKRVVFERKTPLTELNLPLDETCLYFIVIYRQMIKLLLNHKDIDVANTDLHLVENTFLCAIYDNNEDLVDKLLDKGVRVNQEYGEIKMTALITALDVGHDKIIKKLINHGANVNQAMSDGTTPLILMATVGGPKKEDIFELLIRKGAKVNCADKEGNTALIKAIQAKNFHLVKLLTENGADCNLPNAKGTFPLPLAVRIAVATNADMTNLVKKTVVDKEKLKEKLAAHIKAAKLMDVIITQLLNYKARLRPDMAYLIFSQGCFTATKRLVDSKILDTPALLEDAIRYALENPYYENHWKIITSLLAYGLGIEVTLHIDAALFQKHKNLFKEAVAEQLFLNSKIILRYEQKKPRTTDITSKVSGFKTICEIKNLNIEELKILSEQYYLILENLSPKDPTYKKIAQLLTTLSDLSTKIFISSQPVRIPVSSSNSEEKLITELKKTIAIHKDKLKDLTGIKPKAKKELTAAQAIKNPSHNLTKFADRLKKQIDQINGYAEVIANAETLETKNLQYETVETIQKTLRDLSLTLSVEGIKEAITDVKRNIPKTATNQTTTQESKAPQATTTKRTVANVKKNTSNEKESPTTTTQKSKAPQVMTTTRISKQLSETAQSKTAYIPKIESKADSREGGILIPAKPFKSAPSTSPPEKRKPEPSVSMHIPSAHDPLQTREESAQYYLNKLKEGLTYHNKKENFTDWEQKLFHLYMRLNLERFVVAVFKLNDQTQNPLEQIENFRHLICHQDKTDHHQTLVFIRKLFDTAYLSPLAKVDDTAYYSQLVTKALSAHPQFCEMLKKNPLDLLGRTIVHLETLQDIMKHYQINEKQTEQQIKARLIELNRDNKSPFVLESIIELIKIIGNSYNQFIAFSEKANLPHHLLTSFENYLRETYEIRNAVAHERELDMDVISAVASIIEKIDLFLEAAKALQIKPQTEKTSTTLSKRARRRYRKKAEAKTETQPSTQLPIQQAPTSTISTHQTALFAVPQGVTLVPSQNLKRPGPQ